jgi:hypothetical protein
LFRWEYLDQFEPIQSHINLIAMLGGVFFAGRIGFQPACAAWGDMAK